MEQKDSAEWILKQIPYEIVYSARKTLAVQVKADGSVVVRAPKRMAKYKIEAFLKEKQDWIYTHREKALAAAEQKAANRLTEAERKAAVKRAAQMLAEKTAHFAKEMGVTYGRITIREQKTRWGASSRHTSTSTKNVLQRYLFSTDLIVFTPPLVLGSQWRGRMAGYRI